jgi:hypothetical protein
MILGKSSKMDCGWLKRKHGQRQKVDWKLQEWLLLALLLALLLVLLLALWTMVDDKICTPYPYLMMILLRLGKDHRRRRALVVNNILGMRAMTIVTYWHRHIWLVRQVCMVEAMQLVKMETDGMIWQVNGVMNLNGVSMALVKGKFV